MKICSIRPSSVPAPPVLFVLIARRYQLFTPQTRETPPPVARTRQKSHRKPEAASDTSRTTAAVIAMQYIDGPMPICCKYRLGLAKKENGRHDISRRLRLPPWQQSYESCVKEASRTRS